MSDDASRPGEPAASFASGPPAPALAGFWRRLGGAFIDGLLVAAVASVFAAFHGAGSMTEGGRSTLELLLGGAYFTYLHATVAGQTVGNLAVGVRIADADTGAPISYGRAFARFAMSILSGVVFGLGFLWMLWDDRNQTWHDKVASTLVVRTSAYPPSGRFGKPAT